MMTILKREKISKIVALLKNKFVLAGLIIFAVILFILIKNISHSPSKIPVYAVKKSNLEISVKNSGELRAKNISTVMAPLRGGKLKIIYLIPEGTYVDAGTVVVKFDPSDAILVLKTAESELASAISDKKELEAKQKFEKAQLTSQLKGAELSYELSKLRMEQIKFEAKAKQDEARLTHQVDEMKYEDTKQECKSKAIIQKSEMDKMGLKISQKKDALAKAQEALKSLSLESTAKGLVIYGVNWQNQGRKFSIGDEAWGTAAIIEIPDLSTIESITDINEVDISKIKSGQKVMVKLDAFQDQTFLGEVSFIAPLGEARRSNIKVFEVAIDMKNESTILRPGMTTSNKIIINELKNVIFVPIEAVFDHEGKKVVYVRDGSRFKRRNVVLGEKSEDFVVIKEGLAEGDAVALLNPHAKSGNESPGPGSTDLEIPEAKS